MSQLVVMENCEEDTGRVGQISQQRAIALIWSSILSAQTWGITTTNISRKSVGAVMQLKDSAVLSVSSLNIAAHYCTTPPIILELNIVKKKGGVVAKVTKIKKDLS